MAKGIDQKFVQYGIRREDLAMIEAICNAEGIDYDWLSEDILKSYHAKKASLLSKTPLSLPVVSPVNYTRKSKEPT